jgi:hypothetical protein
MKMTRVYPVEGRRVRHPETGELLPPEGMNVPRAGFWLRRIQDGDVAEAPEKPAKAKKEKKEEADHAGHV